jgi:hypothetical protein
VFSELVYSSDKHLCEGVFISSRLFFGLAVKVGVGADRVINRSVFFMGAVCFHGY